MIIHTNIMILKMLEALYSENKGKNSWERVIQKIASRSSVWKEYWIRLL